MFENIVKKIFGTKNDRELKRLSILLKEVNSFEETMTALSDEELKAKTPYFREKLKSGLTLDDILAEAFAVAREASRRVLGMRPFDVQIIGGIALHEGKIAVKVKRLPPHCRFTSTRWKEKGAMLLRSMTIWRIATPNGWGRFINSWD
jgi:hypothetical protein